MTMWLHLALLKQQGAATEKAEKVLDEAYNLNYLWKNTCISTKSQFAILSL